MRLEPPLHVLLAQERCVRWGRDESDQVPQPWLIGRRAQLEPLGIQPVQLVPQPIGTTTKVFEPRFFRSTELSSPSEWRFFQVEPTQTGLIRPHGIGQDTGIAPVILGPRHTVPIPKPVELFGIQRKEVEAAFEQTFDNGAPRHFDGDGYPLRLSRRQRPEPVRQPGKTGSIMVHHSFTHPPTVAVEHIDLMLLRAPINPHKPLVR